ncbi:hypothetical protein SCYAM73S_08155 [Streptomyces cyaneofuscatus]
MAAITADTWWARRPLLPKPPPMCSERTRTEDASRENSWASSDWTQPAPWLESTTSSRPPSHIAVAACGSIMLCCSSGVVYSSSSTTAEAASWASRSPFSVSAGM